MSRVAEVSETRGQIEGAVKDASEKVARSPWVGRVARFGYVTKGVVYMVIGALAVLAVLGAGDGRVTGTRGAFREIAARPFGRVMLAAVAVGLVGYVLWRFVQAALDPEHDRASARRVGMRLIYAGSGLAYTGLALTAAQIVFGADEPDAGSNKLQRDWTAWLLARPYGEWVVGLIGLIVVGAGVAQFYKAYKAKFSEKYKLDEMSRTEVCWARRVGRFGLVARGVVFCVLGVFVVQAALHSNANEVQGLDGALRALARQSFGPWLLGGVAAGLVAYGVFMLVEARYRRIARA